jgi:hypothetical protein
MPALPGPPYEGLLSYDPAERAELARWAAWTLLPSDVGVPADGPPGSHAHLTFRIDSLARRYLRLVHESWLCDARGAVGEMTRRLERTKINDRLGGFKGPALIAVIARVDQILNGR